MLTSMFDLGFDKILRSFENRADYLHKKLDHLVKQIKCSVSVFFEFYFFLIFY